MDDPNQLIALVFAGACALSFLAIGIFTYQDFQRPGGRRARRASGDYLPEGVALFLSALLFSGIWGGAVAYLKLPPTLGVVISQLLSFPIPTSLTIWALMGPDSKLTLSLRPAPRRAILGAALLGLGTWVPMWLYLSLQELIVPIPPEAEEALAELVTPDSLGGLVISILAFALTPAICEEVLMRGGIFGLIRGRLGGRGAVLLSAALFGVLHLQFFRIVPTAILGLILGWVVWRFGSIWPSIALHFVHNTTIIILSMPMVTGGLEETPPWLMGIGVAGLLLGGATLWSMKGAPLVPWVLKEKEPSGEVSEETMDGGGV